MKIRSLVLIFITLYMTAAGAFAKDDSTRLAFPQKEGVQLRYRHIDPSDKVDATCVITIKDVLGNDLDGSLVMVYNCYDENGEPYFGGPNEFVMKIKREGGQTYIEMDKMFKTIKVMDLITAGDVSTIRVPMDVGGTLHDTQIFTTLGIFKTTLTISDKKVMDHKTMNINGIDYDCFLVHEKIMTKTPFGTDTATADTWYAEGAGCVSQTVYDEKGKLKGKLELY